MGAPSITIYRGDTSRLKTYGSRRRALQRGIPRAGAKENLRPRLAAGGERGRRGEEGHYIVVEVPPMKTSLIVVRGDDGKVRAFHNVCRHRGDKLVHMGRARTRAAARRSPAASTPGPTPTWAS